MRQIKTLLLFLASLFMLNSFAITIPSETLHYVPITINNSWAIDQPAKYQQLLVINASAYPQYEASNLRNVFFFYDNGTKASSWLENYSNFDRVIYWIKVNPSIPENTAYTIYMGFANIGVNVFDNVTTGEAPQLSSPYGFYDNGIYVFHFYDNFIGNTLNLNYWDNNTSSGYVVNNGLNTTNVGEVQSVGAFILIYTSGSLENRTKRIWDMFGYEFNVSGSDAWFEQANGQGGRAVFSKMMGGDPTQNEMRAYYNGAWTDGNLIDITPNSLYIFKEWTGANGSVGEAVAPDYSLWNTSFVNSGAYNLSNGSSPAFYLHVDKGYVLTWVRTRTASQVNAGPFGVDPLDGDPVLATTFGELENYTAPSNPIITLDIANVTYGGWVMINATSNNNDTTANLTLVIDPPYAVIVSNRSVIHYNFTTAGSHGVWPYLVVARENATQNYSSGTSGWEELDVFRAIPEITLNVANMTYGDWILINATSTNNDTTANFTVYLKNLEYTLYCHTFTPEERISLSCGFNSSVHGAGNYSVIANETATQNFTGASVNKNMSVSPASPTMVLTIGSDFQYYYGEVRQVNFTISTFNNQLVGNFTINSTQKANTTTSGGYNISGAGIYHFSFFTTGNQNYISNSANGTLTIGKAFPFINLEVGNTTYALSIYINASTMDTDTITNLGLYLNNTLVASNQSANAKIRYQFGTTAGKYKITANQTDTQNYTSDSVSADAYVFKSSPAISLEVGPDFVYNPSYYRQVNYSLTDTLNQLLGRFYLNNTYIANTSIFGNYNVSDVGFYIFTFNTSGNENFSPASISLGLMIFPFISTTSTSTSTTTAPTTSITSTWSIPNITLEIAEWIFAIIVVCTVALILLRFALSVIPEKYK